MGCCAAIPLNEKVLMVKENDLQFQKFTAEQIQDALKLTEDSPILTYPLIKEILRKFNIIYSESDENMLFKPFILLFKKESIRVEDEEEIDPRSLLAIMILMSKSNNKSKSKAIFETFDVGNNNSFGFQEFAFMIRKLLICVDKVSTLFLGDNMALDIDIAQKVQDEIVKKYKNVYIYVIKFENIIRKLKNFCYEQNHLVSLDSKAFTSKILQAKEKLNYDFLSTSG